MPIRALRGAITVSQNTRDAILTAAGELLDALVEANQMSPETVVSAVFTATPDLNAAYPAEAARGRGWINAALLCVQEMNVRGGLPMCLRVLVLWETDKPQSAMAHCYLGAAACLRPDLTGG
jgi:chorismate mutase